MEAVIAYLKELNAVSIAVRLFLAVLIGGLIGLERGKQGRAAGMRTHILVCIGATLTTLLGFYVNETAAPHSDPLRIAAQVVSGIGFLGVGTILLKGRFQITGLTTAACVWASATIGLALGAGFYEGALIAFAAVFLTVTILHKLEYALGKRQNRYGIYVEINSDAKIRSIINEIENLASASDIQVTSARSGIPGNIGIEANVLNKNNQLPQRALVEKLELLEYVVFATESI